MPKRIGNLLPVMTDRNFIKGAMFEHAKKRMDDPTTVALRKESVDRNLF